MKRRKRTGIMSMLILGTVLILAGCGSGGGGGGTPPAPASDYTVGGTVNGLSGTLVLQNNSGDDLTITADGPFTFSTALADGSGYNVTVKTQPDGQTCFATNGSGTVSGADVTDVTVTCSVDTYTVGGTVSGLSGTLTLQNNGGDDLTITADGPFTFSTALADGSGYNVTVKTQPDGQTCFVTNGSGTVSGADVTDVTVDCYNSGSLDPTFNSSGTMPGIIISNSAAGGNGNDWGSSITTDADGKILVTGLSWNSAGNSDMVIWRYNADGAPDTTFGTDGIVVSNNAAGGNGYDWGFSITIDANGKILITGAITNSAGNSDMVIWRYNADGTPDTTFGTDGIVVSNGAAGGNGYDCGYSITIDANGKILVTGVSWNRSGDYDMVIWRYNVDGTPDTTFGTDGIVVSNGAAGGNGDDWGFSITIDAKGRILVSGYSNNGSDKDMVIWRYNTDGTPDTSFGTNGIVVSNNAAGGNGNDYGFSITTDANGKILVPGSSYNGYSKDMVIWRYNTDGTPDTTFDTNGIVVSNNATGENSDNWNFFSISGDAGLSITMDAKGKILVSGDRYNGTDYDMAIWRYIP